MVVKDRVKVTRADMKVKAQDCNNCLDWLPVCSASCCRFFVVDKVLPHKVLFDRVIVSSNLSFDLIRYFRLHGCKYVRGKLIIPYKVGELVFKGEKLFFFKVCTQLSSAGLCGLHADGLKPFACYGYSELTGLCKGDFEVFVPDLCLARFKKND